MGRLRHGRALFWSVVLLGLAWLCLGSSRSFAASIYTRAVTRLTSASRVLAGKGPIPFVLDLSRHKRPSRSAVAARRTPATGHAASRPRATAVKASDVQPGKTTNGSSVAVFGIDAADWAVIDPLVARGQLPTFARLKKVAATGVLKADAPLLSPLIWTTIATGRRPEDHGVLDFLVDVPGGGIAPVNGGARRVQAMWEIWSKAGRSVLVTGWWATWPADRVKGVIVSDRVALPHLRMPDREAVGAVFPPDRAAEVARLRVPADQIDRAALSPFVPVSEQEFAAAVESERTTAGLYRDRIAHLRAAIAATRTYERASITLIAQAHPDLWAVYYELVDTVSHLFIGERRGDGAIRGAYVEMDRALAEAAKALPPETLLVVVSDHGFYPADAGIREDPSDLTSGATAWHRPAGILAVTTAGALSGATGVPARLPGMNLGVASPLDILPTLLACAALPAARDMPGRALPCCNAKPGIQPVASYGAHEQPSPVGDRPATARAEVERLRALGYVSGNSAPSSLARVNLGEILFRKGDYRGALTELEAIVRADPLNARATLWLARTLAELGRTSEAVQQYDRMIQAATAAHRDVDPIVFLAATDLDVREQRIDAAAERLARVPAGLSQAPEVLTARGALAEAQRRPDQAEREYRRALDAAPSDVTALERLVDLLLRGPHAAGASATAVPLAHRFSSSAPHQALAGECALAERRYKDADEYFSKAVALEPDAVSTRVEQARARMLGDRPDAALEALAPLASSREVETIRGAALSKKGDWANAAAAYERALAAGQPSVDLLNGLGFAHLQSGHTKEAAAALERSLQMKADQPEIRKLLDKARARGVGA